MLLFSFGELSAAISVCASSMLISDYNSSIYSFMCEFLYEFVCMCLSIYINCCMNLHAVISDHANVCECVRHNDRIAIMPNIYFNDVAALRFR